MRKWKKLLLSLSFSCLLLLCSVTIAKEATMTRLPSVEHKADFRIAYKLLRLHEGFYSNNSHDAGGETYCGISRVQYPSWIGWNNVDSWKKSHTIHWNDSIPIGILEWQITDHYLNIWVQEGFCDIVDQDIANYVFDMRINMGYGAWIVNTTLSEISQDSIYVSNTISKSTISKLNKAPKWEFIAKLLSNRMEHYTLLVDRRQSQLIFLNHWVKRSLL